MNNTELAELILTKLLENAEKNGYDNFISLQELSKNEFKITDSERIYKISKYLEENGFISPFYLSDGEALASITGRGAIFVEEGGKTGIINKYKNNQINFIMEQKNVNITGVSNSNVSVQSENVNQTIVNKTNDVNAILNSMFELLKQDKSLDNDTKNDYEAEIDTLKAQLKKTNKDKTFIEKTIGILSKCTPLIPLIPKLTEAIGNIL